jgi:hypothetical protein
VNERLLLFARQELSGWWFLGWRHKASALLPVILGEYSKRTTSISAKNRFMYSLTPNTRVEFSILSFEISTVALDIRPTGELVGYPN